MYAILRLSDLIFDELSVIVDEFSVIVPSVYCDRVARMSRSVVFYVQHNVENRTTEIN